MNRKIVQGKFDRLYTDGRALAYIGAYWSDLKTERAIRWLDEPCAGRVLRDYFIINADMMADFIEFAEDCGNKC